jgi:2'-5' RNA ligase
MKAGFAILADPSIHNYARKLALNLALQYRVDYHAALLPPHISLKQPFVVDDLDKLEDTFAGFAARTQPFTVGLERVYYGEWAGSAILGLAVTEIPALRGLHDRLNLELREVVADPSAPFDGPDYRFHLTIEMGPAGERNPYKDYYDQLPEKEINLSFTAGRLALFVSDRAEKTYITYRMLDL